MDTTLVLAVVSTFCVLIAGIVLGFIGGIVVMMNRIREYRDFDAPSGIDRAAIGELLTWLER